jgi:hypothetical protein
VIRQSVSDWLWNRNSGLRVWGGGNVCAELF